MKCKKEALENHLHFLHEKRGKEEEWKENSGNFCKLLHLTGQKLNHPDKTCVSSHR